MATVSHVAPALAARAPAARVSARFAAAPARLAVAPRASAAVRFAARGRVAARATEARTCASARLRTASNDEASPAAGPVAMSDLDVKCAALFATFAVAFFAADPAFAADADAHAAAGAPLFDLAGGEVPFWANMVKYARFSISIMVGFAFMFGRPVVNLLKKPQTAVLVIGGLVGGFKFFKWTIETMSGINDDMTMNY
jgi:hypothetical protein